MNLILLFDDDFTADGHVRLMGRRHAHVRKICRSAVGEELCVGLCGGNVGAGLITVLDDEAVEMDVTLTAPPPSALPVTLALALPRPIMLKRVLSAVSSMGVKRVILFHSRRVEKSFWKSPVLHDENIRAQLVLGLEQARDTVLPTVEMRSAFKPFVEDDLPQIARGTAALLAHPEAAEACPHAVEGPVTLVIGPEGGLVPYEVEKFSGLGFRPVHLGERILRVETAVPALLARLF